MKKLIITFSLAIITSLSLFAVDKKISKTDYVAQWKDEAIYQMVEHNIPASITLAQGLLESGNGNSTLATKANNHFGIKCHSWKGKKVYHDDDKRNECFRKYKNAQESFEDHSIFLKQPRYKFLYDYKITDYKAWAKGLKKAGYATDSKYPKKLIALIETLNLDQYDKAGMKMIKKGEKPARIKDHKPPRGNRPNKDGIPKDEDEIDIPTVVVSNARKVTVSKNKIKYIFAKKGDTFLSIAEELDMMSWQIRKYNDLDKKSKIDEGQIIYIQPKRNKGSRKWCTFQEGDSMWKISQQYGIKLKKLYKKNGLTEGAEPEVGTKLSLKKNVVK